MPLSAASPYLLPRVRPSYTICFKYYEMIEQQKAHFHLQEKGLLCSYMKTPWSADALQPFKDMIEGMRMDLRKSRYMNFDELYLYCYYVAGTVGLMSVPVMGIDTDSQMPTEKVYSAALALGIANQLTNILRDVGEDARRGRIYLPQDELAQAGLSDEDIFAGKVR